LPAKAAGKVVYAPRLYGAATIVFADKRRGVNETRRVAFLVPIEPGVRTIDWETATPVHLAPADLLTVPPGAGEYMPLPAAAMKVPAFTRWAKSLDRCLARTQRVTLPAPAKSDGDTAPVAIAPKRGGVNVELVAIVWEALDQVQS
jgi:hypothetical protein